jgi:hypothetical protein
MSEPATCETCRWWDKILGTILRPERGGSCHRNPPHAGYGWPHTNAEGWCGEHQPKPPHK